MSESLARRLFPGLDPIGRRLRRLDPGQEEAWFTVVGVVGDAQRDPLGSESKAFYVPIEQGTPRNFAFLMRTSVAAESLMPAFRARMRIDPEVALRSE